MRPLRLLPLLLVLSVLLPASPVDAQLLAGAPAADAASAVQRGGYLPPAWPAEWERRAPERVGMDPQRLAEAVRFAVENESDDPRDLAEAHALGFGREPFGAAVGPFRTRGPATGLVIRRGYVVAEWGDPARVDMTFSVTKSFLSTTVGLAVDRGLIRSVDDPVAPYAAPVVAITDGLGSGVVASDPTEPPAPLDLFATEHARTITWDDLLRQTSDWQGTLWGKPDWADRPADDVRADRARARHEPGAVWEYNDTRVNLLALAATQVWRRPLPEVLREEVMDPIGASPTWRWLGYDNSWIVLDGRAVQSVSGGGHWGGGMFISAWDQARFGLLTLRRGRWGDRRILSEEWMRLALTPTPAQTGYGFMNFFLNTDRRRFPSAPETAFAHLGSGVNMVYVDPEHDLVVVARWIENDALDGLIERVLAAVE